MVLTAADRVAHTHFGAASRRTPTGHYEMVRVLGGAEGGGVVAREGELMTCFTAAAADEE